MFVISCEEKPVRNDDNHIVTSDDLLVFRWSSVNNAHSMVYLVPNISMVLCIQERNGRIYLIIVLMYVLISTINIEILSPSLLPLINLKKSRKYNKITFYQHGINAKINRKKYSCSDRRTFFCETFFSAITIMMWKDPYRN